MRKRALPSQPTDYPAGSFIHTDNGYFYVFGPNKRYRIISKRVLASWSPHRVIETTEAAVSKYKVVAKLKFRQGSLIHSIADGRIFLIENGKRRHVVSPDVLTRVGAALKDVVTVSLDEILLHEEGEPLK